MGFYRKFGNQSLDKNHSTHSNLLKLAQWCKFILWIFEKNYCPYGTHWPKLSPRIELRKSFSGKCERAEMREESKLNHTLCWSSAAITATIYYDFIIFRRWEMRQLKQERFVFVPWMLLYLYDVDARIFFLWRLHFSLRLHFALLKPLNFRLEELASSKITRLPLFTTRWHFRKTSPLQKSNRTINLVFVSFAMLIWFTFYFHRGASRLRDPNRRARKSFWP